ncbi:short-chain dehydrogenase [Actinoalloteichus sp. AHMU CJ021]|uniref:NAD(P)-dependent dehydrogenase, short-chain alcohol dehydrogenase family n=1 Tax=Actinoalloteichus caeruleus DSM 43889 TaxID=1120930 RepID=A0ABT1JLM6_ACTCY|nr:SDR family oxidoreductase [Actinoalloteichus caeruleus]AUS78862.1 short-chain dehydrogenase [Actinoalloteichus sp. AHMU CJ021]MCP2333058.1 NAD(P)-dependent dehydrogenase, short-chain alcohol dehydrogenase family [Actinoalloteichus caeruleus DSM 43889]
MAEKNAPLHGRVAVVTGGTRGCGRGIAVELGASGATVYVTGRTSGRTRSPLNRAETIEETAELVTSAGGTGIPVVCDHNSVADVTALAQRIHSEQDGRLDILVDDVWGGDPLVVHGTPFWETSLEDALRVLRNGVETHLVTAHTLLPLLIARPGGLLVEVTDGDDDEYVGTAVPYFLVKSAMRRLGTAFHHELAPFGGAAVTVSPGFLRSERMLDHFGVTEENWRDGIERDPHFAISETPRYLGRAVAALAADPDVSRWGGRGVSSGELAAAYGVRDLDGSQPDAATYIREVALGGRRDRTADDYR